MNGALLELSFKTAVASLIYFVATEAFKNCTKEF